MTNTIYVLNGPNLNLLGLREPEIYGSTTLDEIAGMLEDRAAELGFTIDMRQTNHEGMLVDWLHEAQAEGARAVLLNAAAYTHTSIALLVRGEEVLPARGSTVLQAGDMAYVTCSLEERPLLGLLLGKPEEI